jgi:CheY-like chemotaxis protein
MKLMWIDDNPFETQSSVSFLELHDYEVEFISNYAEAVEQLKAKAKEYGLIILDIQMPPGDLFGVAETRDGVDTGLKVYELIRKNFAGPILIYTIIKYNLAIEKIVNSDRKSTYLKKPANGEVIVGEIERLRQLVK